MPSTEKATRRLNIVEIDTASAEILTYAHQLHAAGERPWFEVWYPNTTEETFDAVEFFPDTGEVLTLAPYETVVV